MVTTSVKRGYTATVQNIYGAPPSYTEEHHEVIEEIQTIVQGMQTQGYDLEGLAQANAVLTRSNYMIIAQLVQMIVTMNVMQAQLKTIASVQTDEARPKKTFYLCSCRRNFTHGRKTRSTKKAGNHKEKYYNKMMVGSEKGCE